MGLTEAVSEWYTIDEMFWLVPIGTSCVAALSFWLHAIPFTLLAWFDPVWARKWRVQPDQVPSREKVREIIVESTKYFFINYVVSMCLAVAIWPSLRSCGMHGGELPAWWLCLLQVAMCALVEDFWFYWVHRLLHHPLLYKHVHKQHHKYKAPIAMVGAYLHPLEQQIIVAGILAGPVIIGSIWGLHYQVLWVWFFFRNWETAEEHCGYDLPYLPSKLLPLYDGPAYHDYHHRVFDGNYGAVTCIWDRMFGTVAAGYDEYIAAKEKLE